MLISFIHEYIHNTNLHIFDDKVNNDNLMLIFIKNDASSLLELPSIAIEIEFLEWLFSNNYISDIDYRLYRDFRLSSTIDSIKKFKSISRTVSNEHLINTKVYIESVRIANICFSYIVATALAPCINERLGNSSKYRDRLVLANDKLLDSSFDEIIRILDLDYTDDKVYEEIKRSFFNYYKDYFRTSRKTK